MPRTTKSKLKIKKTSPPPPGYDKIAPTILKYKQKLKSATTNSTSPTTSSTVPGAKPTSLWPIYKITHDVTKYIYDLHTRQKISDELYTWLTLQDYVDSLLIAKWKKQGYEKLCCTQCITGGSTCICRVPKVELLKRGQDDKVDVECVTCGCRGCASSD